MADVLSLSLDGTGALKVESEAMPHITGTRFIERYSGSLFHNIYTAPVDERLHVCKQVIELVIELRIRSIHHGSICAANVSWDSKSNTISLINAGLFNGIQQQMDYVPLLPCCRYRSREELAHDEWKPSQVGDIYALTVLFYSIFSGVEPYSTTPLVQVIPKIARFGHTGLEKPALMPLTLWSALGTYWNTKSSEGRQSAFQQVQAALL